MVTDVLSWSVAGFPASQETMALLQQPNYKHRGTSSSHGYSDETRTKKTNDTLNTDMEWMKIVVISLFLCVISVLCVSSDMVDLSVSADDDTQEVDSCLSQLQHNLYWPHNLSSPCKYSCHKILIYI